MNNLRLEDGMELMVMPIPFDHKTFLCEYSLIYDGISRRYIYVNNNSDIDKNIFSTISHQFFKFKKNGGGDYYQKYNTQNLRRFFVYVLYNNELYITNFGFKLKQKLEECSYGYDKDFKFKKIYLNVKQMGSFPNYDYTTISNDYYKTKYTDLNDYLTSLNDKQFNYINNILSNNSCSNPKNYKNMSDIFNRLELNDFMSYLRREKINKIKEKIC